MRAALIDGPAAEKIASRAHALRTAAGRLSGDAVGERLETDADRVTVVRDVIAAWSSLSEPEADELGTDGLKEGPSAWLHALERVLAERSPNRYAGLAPGWLGDRLRAAGVRTMNGRKRNLADGEQSNRVGVAIRELERVVDADRSPTG